MNPGAPTGSPDPMLGQLLDGRYQIIRKLGEGGMGEVYAAQHIRLGKPVAIKLLRHEIVSNQEAVKRFEQEARSASAIGHKNIIGILDSGELPDGRIYLSMEYLEGKPLNELIKEPLPVDRLLNILIQTGHGLAAAHKLGIVHRDMKPENVYVTISDDGEVPKLLDFGIAKMTGNEGNNHLTKTGTIFGTPFYMAPEQALGQNVDQRADIYAMGVIMYEVFAGAVPFAGESFMAILTQHITAEPKSPSRMAAEHGRTVPPGIEEIIVRAMKKEPDQRFQSMEELVGALVAVYRGLAGSGMSSYLQAMPGAPPSAMMAAATPMPYGGPGGPSGGHRAEAYGGHPHATPQHTPQHHGSAPYPAQTPYPGPSASYDVPRKSRTGLIVLLVFLLLGGGGAAAAFVVIKNDEGKTGKGGDERKVADARDVDQGGKTTPAATTDAGATTTTTTPAAADAGAKTTTPEPAAAIDAGAKVTTPDPAPAPQPVTVMVNSKPQGADVYRADKKLPGRTPMLVKVTPGEPVELVLRRKRYKDTRVTIDGTKEKVSPELDRAQATSPTNPTNPTNPDPGPDEPDGPDDQVPDKPLTLEERCKKDPTLEVCNLE